LPDASVLARKLVGLHEIAYILSTRIDPPNGAPEIKLEADEAEELARDIVNCMREFGFSVSGKFAALIGLASTAAAVYAPRAVMIIQRKKMERARDVTPVKNNATPES
jgi:hypothetical protein